MRNYLLTRLRRPLPAELIPVNHDQALVSVDHDQALVLPTPYEKLLEKIAQEKRRGDVFRTIMSVYFFMRANMLMIHRAITIEEFEIAEKAFKDFLRDNKSSDVLMKGSFINRRGFYGNGLYLNIRNIGFGHTNPWGDSNDVKYLTFSPDSKYVIDLVHSGKYSLVFPSNTYPLLDELCIKRFGSKLMIKNTDNDYPRVAESAE